MVVTIQVEIDQDNTYWPAIGDRIQDMLICQPPMYDALVHVRCPLDDDDMYDHTPVVQLQSVHGLTVWNLYNMIKLLIYNHEGCRDPPGYGSLAQRRHRHVFTVRFLECLTDEEWDDAEEETQRFRHHTRRLREKEARLANVNDSDGNEHSRDGYEHASYEGYHNEGAGNNRKAGGDDGEGNLCDDSIHE